ncbi:MAG: NAD(P)H-dependent oxidoreductase [Lachnospiraceae bacterium]|nr:NAD(P)H-dependent oxidoreductase [Lachnospiraceae bacterium]
MKILVLNGSPKGKYSITLQTVLYLEKKFKECEFEVLHVGQTIKALEKDFTKAKEAIETADALLFSYPVYTFIAPCQLHRFIELMKEHKVDVADKFATQISTSKHFYDVTAHRYVMENCQDMGMKFVRGLSADMDDLTKEKGQQEAVQFMEYFLWNVLQDVYEPLPVKRELPPLAAATVPTAEEKTLQKDVVIITDCESDNQPLQNMIARFQAVLPCTRRVVNIREYPFRGGCLGCFNCAVSGKCIYTDGFDEFLRNSIQTADAMVYAFSIKDHSMGAVFKMYDDRQFCNGHRTVTMGMPIGYLISGYYSQEENLRMIVEGRCEVGSNFFAGVASDEQDADKSVDAVAAKLSYALEKKLTQPQNFFGIGGMKIFRDLIYLMQGMMKADHKFYKEHGQYDFPQKQKGTLIKMYLVGMLISNPKIKGKIGNQMNEGMIAPYKKVLDKVE